MDANYFISDFKSLIKKYQFVYEKARVDIQLTIIIYMKIYHLIINILLLIEHYFNISLPFVDCFCCVVYIIVFLWKK